MIKLDFYSKRAVKSALHSIFKNTISEIDKTDMLNISKRSFEISTDDKKYYGNGERTFRVSVVVEEIIK